MSANLSNRLGGGGLSRQIIFKNHQHSNLKNKGTFFNLLVDNLCFDSK